MRRPSRIELERPQTPVRLTGRTVVVTGASSGLGWGAALALRRSGADIVAVVRSEREARKTRAAVMASPGVGEVDAFAADLASVRAVDDLAKQIRDRHPRIHGLVHSAGLRLPERRTGPDGTEIMFAVEVAAPFLLTSRLLGALEAGAPSRVIVVSGEAHRKGRGAPRRFDATNLQGERTFRPEAHAKHLALARILFTQELARRLLDSGITVLSVAPGATRTALFRHYPPHLKAAAHLGLLLQRAQPAEAGGQYLSHAMTDPELAGTSGRYLLEGREVVPSPAARSAKSARALWSAVETILGERFLPEDERAT